MAHFPLPFRVRNQLRQTVARDWVVAYRHRGLQPDDVMLAAYPKSGSTWMTFMLAQLLWKVGREQTFIDNRFLPEVGKQDQAEKLLPSGGRLVRTHERFRPEYQRAIYVVRDGRDVAVSLYYQLRRASGMVAEFSEYLDMFLDGWLNGAGPWSQHVEEWLDAPAFAAGKVLLVRYEDMKEDAARELKRAAAFLDVESSEVAIADAIQAGSLESMKNREKHSQDLAHRETGERIPVVRKGVSGDWRNHFSSDDHRKFIHKAGEAMKRLGYDVDMQD